MLNRKGRQREARERVERVLAAEKDPDLGALYAELKGLRMEPARSTFYGWVKQWRDERARDDSDPWLLADDDTGDPGLVLRVASTLWMRAKLNGGEAPAVSKRDARWLVRIAQAVPMILAQPWELHRADGTAELIPVEVTLWEWALRYGAADTAAPEVRRGRLATLDQMLAVEFILTTGPVRVTEAVWTPTKET